MMLNDESELLLKLRNGSHEAFETIYQLYKASLARNFLRLLHDEELAQDALQDLFLKLWNARSSIDPDRSFKAYLYQIAQHIVVDIYRRAASDKQMQARMMADVEETYVHVEEHMMHKEQLELVNRIIDQLPEERRRVYVLHKMEGKSYKEINQLMGLAPTVISKHIFHSTQFIKKHLQAHSDLFLVLWLATVLF